MYFLKKKAHSQKEAGVSLGATVHLAGGWLLRKDGGDEFTEPLGVLLRVDRGYLRSSLESRQGSRL